MLNKHKRQARVRAKLKSSSRPRLSVHRTSRHLYAQLIDDSRGVTLASASTKSLKVKGTKSEQAEAVGTQIAKLVTKAKIKSIVFDRGSYRYHGRVKALASAARKGGLSF